MFPAWAQSAFSVSVLDQLLVEQDAECGAVSGFAGFYEDASAVVLFYDAAGKGEAKPPSAAFRGEAGTEYVLPVAAHDALACVADIDGNV